MRRYLLALPLLLLPGCALLPEEDSVGQSGACLLTASRASELVGGAVERFDEAARCAYRAEDSAGPQLEISFVEGASAKLPSPAPESASSLRRETLTPRPELGAGVQSYLLWEPQNTGPNEEPRLSVSTLILLPAGGRTVRIALADVTPGAPEHAIDVGARAVAVATELQRELGAAGTPSAPPPSS